MGSGDMELADGVLTRNHAYCGPRNEPGRPPKAAIFKTDSYLVINERVAFMSQRCLVRRTGHRSSLGQYDSPKQTSQRSWH